MALSTSLLADACLRVDLPSRVAPSGIHPIIAGMKLADVDSIVELVADDTRKHIERFDEIAFCFLDVEKEVYGDFYEMVIPRLAKGGLLIAGDAINHRETLQTILDHALSDESVNALVVPIGKSELVCRKI